MASDKIVQAANSHLPETLPIGYTAVFLGGTSGIGRSTLEQLVKASKDKQPRVYVVGRSASAAVPLLAELRQTNASARITFIERDVSLIKEVDKAVEEVKKSEDKLDLLFLSTGFMSFQGRQENAEGLEPSLTTRYYSRVRAIQLLLPLLNRSSNPHVTNILAGGEEGPLIEDDLDLARPGNYTVGTGSTHAATMLTLTLERFASENPKISFVHAFPGITATTLLTRGSSGFTKLLMTWVVAPLIQLLATNVNVVGARALFYSTNARYSVLDNTQLATPLPEGLLAAGRTEKGLFLIGAKGETPKNDEVLGDLRERMAAKVWEHTTSVFDRVVG